MVVYRVRALAGRIHATLLCHTPLRTSANQPETKWTRRTSPSSIVRPRSGSYRLTTRNNGESVAWSDEVKLFATCVPNLTLKVPFSDASLQSLFPSMQAREELDIARAGNVLYALINQRHVGEAEDRN